MMIQIRSICLSAHLDSFCRKLNELVGLEFVYQTDDPGSMRRRIGWRVNAEYEHGLVTPEADRRAETCEILVEMLRELDLMERRIDAGRRTVYVSERWLKPLVIKGRRLPGILRVFSPSYFKMVRRFVRLMDSPHFYVFPCGVHAVRDFVRLYRLMHGDVRCLFRAPKILIERKLGGVVAGFPRVRLWGYFVAPSMVVPPARKSLDGRPLRIFWCGGMIDWKRVDILVKAFHEVLKKRSVALLIVGEGKERSRLGMLAGVCYREGLDWVDGMISFSGYVTNDKVRSLMQEADVYVMPSNAEEGWGAALSDALTVGCPVISTYEAGSSATLLPDRCLYHADSVSGLVDRLLQFNGEPVEYSAVEWGGENAASILLKILMH